LFSTYKKLEMVLKDGLEPSRSKATDFLNLTLPATNEENELSNLYWVSTEVIENLRPKVRCIDN